MRRWNGSHLSARLEYIPPVDAYPVMRKKMGIEPEQRVGPGILASLIGEKKADASEEAAES